MNSGKSVAIIPGRKRNYEALCRAVERAVPGAAIEEHDNGELVIYTGLAVERDEDENETGKVRPLTEAEFFSV